MPRIDIKEVDNTSPVEYKTISDAVYVPGYSICGPTGVPTLCTTLDEFTSKFGDTPYNLGTDINPNYEKSYLYAYELIKLGLPVYFERVDFAGGDTAAGGLDIPAGSANAISGGAEIKKSCYLRVAAKFKGTYYNSIAVTFDKSVITVKKGEKVLEEIYIKDSLDAFVDSFKSDYIVCKFIARTADSSNEEVGKFYPNSKTTVTLAGTGHGAHYATTDGYSESEIKLAIHDSLEKLRSRDDYDIKYWTSGAYNILNHSKMANSVTIKTIDEVFETLAVRGDTIGIIDYNYDSAKTISGHYADVINAMATVKDKSYGATFTTYATHVFEDFKNYTCMMPPSFNYLKAVARSLQTNPSYLAAAGVKRGKVPGLQYINEDINNSIADGLVNRDGISINPILHVNPYGVLVWGNRTLKDNSERGLTATSFLNIRSMVCDIKKLCHRVSKMLTFEQNSDILWINFKGNIAPILDQMKVNGGISNYKIIKKVSKEKAKLVALIKISPIEAVEDFDITIEMTDSGTIVE